MFAGTFSVTAAEDVCDATLDTLGALVDLSLVRPVGDDRFLLLDTVRQYAAEQLACSPDESVVRARHAEVFVELGEAAYSGRVEAEEQWTARLELENGNLRAALDWLTPNDADRGLALAGGLGWFWQARSRSVEGAERLGVALAASSAGGAIRARALTAAAALAGWQGDVATARLLMDDALALA